MMTTRREATCAAHRRGVGAAVAALVMSACAGEAETGVAFDPNIPIEQRYGGTVVLAGTTDIPTFNPVATTDELSAAIQRDVVLMTLLRPDADLEPQPYLAESWEINADSTRVEFRLRKDIDWHDGRPTTAWDVEFTFAALKNPETGFPNAGAFSGWEGPEVLDEHTIRFAVRPHAGLLSGWMRLPILPRHLMSDTPADELATHPFGAEPTGNGPFRFAGSRSADTWIFEANGEFPEGLGGRAFMDRLVYRSIPEPATQLAELRAGGVQLVRLASPTQLGQARRDAELVALDYPSRSYGFVAWNGKRPWFRDAAVRRALTMAIDRQAIVDAVRGGLGEVANGPIGPWHPAYDSARSPLPFSTDSAVAILEAAGWRDSDGDGVRDQDGTRFSFELLTNERDTYRQIAEIVQAQLGAIGVDVTLRTLETSAFVDIILSPERRFDAFVLEWEPDFVIDDRQLFACAAVGEMFQFSSYCNPALEPTLDSIPIAGSRDDSERWLRAYARVIHEDQPFSFLYFSRDATIYRRELQGVAPDIRGDLTNVTTWWVHPDVRTEVASASVP